MQSFWVMWTYVANYSTLTEMKANSAQEAHDAITGYFGADFKKNATVYVFDRPPVMKVVKGEKV